jgi:CheY-like chemotaxis protein
MQTEHTADTATAPQPVNSSQQYLQLPPEELRICVVEDNPVNRKIMTKFLDRLCYTNFHLYENGKLAVEGIRRQAADGEPYHLVFMDAAMPVMGGFEAIRLIRTDENEAVRNVIIIGMHAHSIERLAQQEFLPRGANDVISKPIRMQSLREIMETVGNPPVCHVCTASRH